MPTPLQRPNPQKRKSGWLLRDAYKGSMQIERKNVRERMNDPNFNPQKSVKYNVKKAIFRSAGTPQISRVIEEYVGEGLLSKDFAKSIIQDVVFIQNKSLTKNLPKEELIRISKNPKKGIETEYNKVSFISEHKFDPVTKNRVTIQRLSNGNVTVIVKPKN